MLKDTTYLWTLTLAVAVHAGVLLPGAWQSPQVQFDPGDSAVTVFLPPSPASSAASVAPAQDASPQPQPEPQPQPASEAAPPDAAVTQPPPTVTPPPAPARETVDPSLAWREALADARQATAPVLQQALSRASQWAQESATRPQPQTPAPSQAPASPTRAASAPTVDHTRPASSASDGDLADPGVFIAHAVANQVKPIYPPLSRRRGEHGTAVFLVTIAPDGRPASVQLQRSSGHARLDEAAQAAAWASTYRPALRGQRPVTTRTTIAFTFRLTESDGR